MSALEVQLDALKQERNGYAARIVALSKTETATDVLFGYMQLVSRVNKAIIELARRFETELV